jgi:hypothetical protein
MIHGNSKACASCDYQNPVTARFCARCGVALVVPAVRPQTARRWVYLAGCLVAIVLVGVGVLAAVVWGRPLFEPAAIGPPTWDPLPTEEIAPTIHATTADPLSVLPAPAKTPTSIPTLSESPTSPAAAFPGGSGSLASLPEPVTELTNAAGTWTQHTNGNWINDLLFYQGNLWAATRGGVIVWDSATGRYNKYTTLDGLVSNMVITVELGPDRTLWFGTWGGVSHYDPTTGRWQNFTVANGLAHDIVTVMAVGVGMCQAF